MKKKFKASNILPFLFKWSSSAFGLFEKLDIITQKWKKEEERRWLTAKHYKFHLILIPQIFYRIKFLLLSRSLFSWLIMSVSGSLKSDKVFSIHSRIQKESFFFCLLSLRQHHFAIVADMIEWFAFDIKIYIFTWKFCWKWSTSQGKWTVLKADTHLNLDKVLKWNISL